MDPQCSFPNQSLHKKSIFGLKMTSAVYLLLFAICLAGVSAGDPISCPDVRKTFEKKGMLSLVDIQDQPNSDVGELCLSEGCCAASSRAKLTQQARTQLEGALRSELSKLAEVLANRARRFDEFFRKLLKLSREEFHAMFKRTYGMIYEQHSYVFEQLFEQLERYYSKGGTNFDTMMEGFFGILYQKMFTVLNAQYSFDDKYLKCVNEHMREIEPFEDVPNKLSVQLKRAFVATRTFHKALRAGADVVRSMMQVGVTQECVTAWTRLRYCGSCSGLTPPPCSRYCHNVLRGCLPAHADLADLWDGYVDGVEKVADRLLGPFNIAMVVEPIDIKISEAIMSFQEHNQEISQKIFASCGKLALGGAGKSGPFYAPSRSRRAVKELPDFDIRQKENDGDDFEIEASFESLDDPLLMSLRTPEAIRKATKEMEEQAKSRERFLQYMRGDMELEEYEEHERRKREADPEPAGGEVNFKPFEFESKRPKKKKPVRVDDDDDNQSSDWANRQLQNVVKETRNPLKTSKQYWRHLPAVLCTSTSVTSSPCYNGSHVASYTLSGAGEGSAALASNPEVRGLPPAAPALDTAQQALRTLTARLKDAYNGLEVQWNDDDELALSASASASNQEFSFTEGSGSGSGDDTDDTEDLPDDDEDSPYYPEGSGKGPDDEVTAYRPAAPPAIPPVLTPAPEAPIVPIIPSVVDSPPTKNVETRGRVDQPESFDPVDNTIDEDTKDQPPPVQEQPLPSSAQTISLHRAMFTYAFPVVCAWFGTIVTDLF